MKFSDALVAFLYEGHKLQNEGFCAAARLADGLGAPLELILAVLRSLRNSDKLIFPSLSMSASSSSGSIEPFRPVCCSTTI